MAAKDKRKRATRICAARLLGALKDVIGAVASSAKIPVLGNVLIEAGDGAVVLVATDLDMEARRECASDDRDGPGSAEWIAAIRPFAVTAPAKPLLAVLGEIDAEAMVTLAVDDETDRLVITAGRSRFRLATLPVQDFPKLKRGAWDQEWTIGAAVLSEAIDSVAHAISTEETRYYLNGVYLHSDGLNLRFVATDGRKLALNRIDAPAGAAAWPAMILPRGLIGELVKALARAAKGNDGAQVNVYCDESGKLVQFAIAAIEDGGALTLTGKTIDGTFPDYERVIPRDAPHELVVPRDTLIEAVERVSALASKDSPILRLDIGDDRVELSVVNPELGDAREELPVSREGPAIGIGFNGRFLREALKRVSTDDVVMRWTDESAPVRFDPSGSAEPGALPACVLIVMPCRV